MLICYKTRGGLNLNVNGVNIKLTGSGLIDNIDDKLYQKAKEIYTFLTEWEKDGIIEVNQNNRKDDEVLEAEIKKQDEVIEQTEKSSGTKIKRAKKA